MMTKACIALGSNLGDREAIIKSAIDALRDCEGIKVDRISSIYETEPVGPSGQGPFLNAAVKVSTSLSARALLELLLRIEREHGRDRTRAQRWGPRRLDLDLLLYQDDVIDEPGLTVPHPHLHERMFVLAPLVEIAGDWVHPELKRSVRELRDDLIPESGEIRSGRAVFCNKDRS